MLFNHQFYTLYKNKTLSIGKMNVFQFTIYYKFKLYVNTLRHETIKFKGSN